jgi:hypothetical protein
MNTADDAYRDRRNKSKASNSVDSERHSTELTSSSKARIKIINTRFPVDFFCQVPLKLQIDLSSKP